MSGENYRGVIAFQAAGRTKVWVVEECDVPLLRQAVGGGGLVGSELPGSNFSSIWLKTGIIAASRSPRASDKLAFL